MYQVYLKLTQKSVIFIRPAFKHVGNTTDGFMSEGNKQAPISSGWWYDLNLSLCISPLLCCWLSFHTCPCSRGLKGTSCPLLATQNTATFSLSPVFRISEAACGHLLSRLLFLFCFLCLYESVLKKSHFNAGSRTTVGC